MSKLRDRSGAWLESLGRFFCRHHFEAALAVLALTDGLASQLPKLKIDISNQGFFFRSDPAILTYNAFRDQFGRDELIIAAINPADIFDEKFLLKLKAFHEDLEKEVSYVERVTSLINAESIRWEGDALIVEDLPVDCPSVPRAMGEMDCPAASRGVSKLVIVDFIAASCGN
jgi:predicted RND superfamily exporter protein